MEETLVHPPRTMMELFQSLPEGTAVQLIHNQVVMSPAPLDPHQRLINEIYPELSSFVKRNRLGTCRTAPYDVFLDEENAYQPDICYISKERDYLRKRNGMHGAPDLVIEVLSPGTARYDRGVKKRVYESAGVLEYWLVDPETNEAVGYRLENDRFVEFFQDRFRVQSQLLALTIEWEEDTRRLY